jgi:sec-independent protein translocase protein TatA
MGLDNPIHVVLLLIVLLLVFGAKRLPEIGRSLGEGMRGFKDSVSGISGPTHAETIAPAPAPAPVQAAAPQATTVPAPVAAQPPPVPPPAPPPVPPVDAA